ncbi:MAG: hypothetical protein ABJK20_03285 [Halieaceae bacterium]
MKYRVLAIMLSCFWLPLGSAKLVAGSPDQFEVSADTFTCIRDMSPVRGFYVDNLSGNLEGTLAAANAADGAEYPAGSVVQLVPGEAMIKRAPGFSPATRDWEFFELDTSTSGTEIRNRGFADVVNRFGGNCLACHAKAKPQWDMVCETGHGCDPIPLTRDLLVLLQKTDPRCDNNPALSPEEIVKLKALQQSLQPQT